jgi:hypothetical protein
LWTGVVLVREFVRICTPGQYPQIVFLTNVDAEELKAEAGDLPIHKILSKPQWHPKKFADFVDALLPP